MKNVAIVLLILLLFLSGRWAQSQTFTTNQDADLMISGVDFNNAGGALMFNHPNGLASNGTNLILCDRFNNRVLIWHTAPGAWNTPPDLVLGQADFISNNPGTSKGNMNWPGNASVANNGKLAIADTNNDRLLLWNNFPTSNGEAADVSIHLLSIAPAESQQRWAWPWGVWTDGTKLAAVATQGSTLLFWNTFPTSDDQEPDYTITHEHFGTPRNISTDGSTYFFVGDHNARVNNIAGTFFWNSYPTSEDQAYDFYRDEWIKGTVLASGQLIASGLMNIYTWDAVPLNAFDPPDLIARPSSYNNGDGVDVVEANDRIYICNYNGNNLLVYDEPPTVAEPDPLFALGVSNYQYNTLDSIGYMQNPCLARHGNKLIVTSDFDRRIYLYNNLPTTSGVKPDEVISTQNYDLAPWANVLHENKFVAVGRNKICIWNDVADLDQNPSVTYLSPLGSASFQDLKGVAMDNRFFYLSDRNGQIFIWNGIPGNNATDPAYTLDYGNVNLNRISSDGTYFCVTQQSPPSIFIYKVSEISAGNTEPWKIIDGKGLLNLPSDAMTYNGSLAISNQSFHNVLFWDDIDDAPDQDKMVVLGQPSNSPSNSPAIGQNRLFMPGSMLFENNHLWVGEHKFSSRVLRFSTGGTGVDNKLNESIELTVYPNPLTDGVYVKFFVANPSQLSIMIENSVGQHIRTIEKNREEPAGEQVVYCNLSDLPLGHYFIVVTLDKRKRYRHIVKQ